MAAIRNWLSSLQPRERVFVIAGAVLVVAVAVYTVLLAPFYAAIDQRAERVERKTLDLAWMRSVATELRDAGPQAEAAGASGGESLVVLVDRTAREAGLGSTVTGQTPTGDAGIRVRLESAPFDTLVLWLGGLEQRYGIVIESATVDRSAQTGLVNASVVLSRPDGAGS